LIVRIVAGASVFPRIAGDRQPRLASPTNGAPSAEKLVYLRNPVIEGDAPERVREGTEHALMESRICTACQYRGIR
jgi:hypothetical protein